MAIIALLFLMAAQPPVEELLEAKLLARVAVVDAELKGVMGAYAIDLKTGRTIGYHADSVFPQASSIKIPILIELFRQVSEGKVNLAAKITLEPRETVGGSGHLQGLLKSGPVTLTVEELAKAMIQTSDNTATNKLISMVGMQNVNATIERMGFHQTRLQRIMIDAEAAAQDRENISTPMEMARIMETIYRGRAVSYDASQQMIEILKLPEADFRKTVPKNVVVAAKPGGLTGVHCETGVIFVEGRPFVLSVAGTFLTDDANPVPAVTRLFYDHFATLAKSNKYGNGGVR